MQRQGKGGAAKEQLLAPELEELLALTAHELHEPLRKIVAFGDLLRQHAGPALDDESLDYLDRIARASERMRATLGHVIAYARVPRGLPFVTIDLGESATGAFDKVREVAAACGAVIEIAALPCVDGDPFQMQQLFELLLDNAIKFRREDAPLVVRVESAPADESEVCVVRVSDNGQGFEDSYAERIFQPFERLHPRGKYPGAGMGLPICRKIAERHGGILEASGVPGAGAVLTLKLPLPAPARRRRAEDPDR